MLSCGTVCFSISCKMKFGIFSLLSFDNLRSERVKIFHHLFPHNVRWCWIKIDHNVRFHIKQNGLILTTKMNRAPMSTDTTINCNNPNRNNQLNPNTCSMVIAKYTVMKLHHATHDTNMKNGPLKTRKYTLQWNLYFGNLH